VRQQSRAWRNAAKKLLNKTHEKLATQPQDSSCTKLVFTQPESVQRETYIRANNNKKKIKEADFPAEPPEGNSYKYEADNAEHSLHDLSSDCPKECSLTEFNESCDRAKNYSGTKQAERNSVPEVFPRDCHSLMVACRHSKPYAQNGEFSPKWSKCS
jgi:hypothetical protein